MPEKLAKKEPEKKSFRPVHITENGHRALKELIALLEKKHQLTGVKQYAVVEGLINKELAEQKETFRD